MCLVCKQFHCHYRCPNFIKPNAKLLCDICDEGIYPKEEYIENDKFCVAHVECLEGLPTKQVVSWLGIEIREVDEC